MVIPSHTVSTGHTARTANGGSCLSARKPMRHRGPPRGDPSVMRTGTAGTAAQGAPQGPRPASYAPSGGLAWLGRFAVRHPRPILAAAGLFVIIAVVFGSSAAAHLSSGGFIDPGAQSTQAGQVLGQTFRSEDPSFVVLATVRHGNINSPAARKAGHALAVILNDDMGLADVQSYWAIHNSYWAVGNHHNPVLHSRDGRQALILGYATGDAATRRPRPPPRSGSRSSCGRTRSCGYRSAGRPSPTWKPATRSSTTWSRPSRLPCCSPCCCSCWPSAGLSPRSSP